MNYPFKLSTMNGSPNKDSCTNLCVFSRVCMFKLRDIVCSRRSFHELTSLSLTLMVTRVHSLCCSPQKCTDSCWKCTFLHISAFSNDLQWPHKHIKTENCWSENNWFVMCENILCAAKWIVKNSKYTCSRGDQGDMEWHFVWWLWVLLLSLSYVLCFLSR